MNDLDLVRQIRADVPPPTGTRLAPGRARLLTSIARKQTLPAHPLRRRSLVAAMAAGILVAGGTAYGLTAGLSSPGTPARTAHPAAAGLTAVSGCPGLDAVSGRLVKVTAASLTLITIRNGHPVKVTVTTSASTQVNRQVTGSYSSIADGDRVYVRGTGSHGRIAAQFVNLNVDLTKLPARQSHPNHRSPSSGLTLGTVTGTRAGGFTVTMILSGARVPVTTSPSTTILTLASAHLSQLQIGGFTAAVGHPRPHGTLAAATVDQGAHLLHIGPAVNGNAGPDGPTLGCSPSVIATAFLSTH